MTSRAKSVFFFGWYLLAAGASLYFVPNTVFGLVGLPLTSEPWPRIAGALTFILGVFFVDMARQDVRPFLKTTLYGRGTFIVAVTALVALGLAPPAVLLFVAVDAAGFVWTLSTK